jgi:hypothetical protein
LPVDLEFQLADCLDAIRPRLKWPQTFQEADERVKRVEKQSRIPLPGRLDGDSSIELENGVMWSIGKVSDTDTEDANVDSILQSGSEQEKTQEQQQQQQQESEDKRVQRRIEELKFDKEFQSVLQESLSERKTVQKPLKMMSVKEMMEKSGIASTAHDSTATTIHNNSTGPFGGQVKFTVLMRRGKTLAKDITIPQDSALGHLHPKEERKE